MEILPGEFYGQRSLVGHSPWGLKKSDMIERLNTPTQVTKWSVKNLSFLEVLQIINHTTVFKLVLEKAGAHTRGQSSVPIELHLQNQVQS